MENTVIVNSVLLVIGFLSLAIVSSIFLKKLNFPYTIGLVVVGALVGFIVINTDTFPAFKDLVLTPDVILYLILPTLIFDASINIDVSVLKRNIVPILLLAVVGVLISAGIIGYSLSFVTTMSLSGALLFGALISATDPVAVIALFNEVGAPKRLVTLIDGESIFNDATAIVLFTILLASINSGIEISSTFFVTAIFKFLYVLLGGMVIGSIIGYFGSLAVRFKKNELLLQVTISLIMAYVSFIVADHFFHVSGVMSTLAAGIIFKYFSENEVKQENLHYLENFWAYFSFVANSFVFLLLGLTEFHSFRSLESLKNSLIPLLWAILAISIGRIAVVYILMPAYNRFNKLGAVPLSFQHILFWGGLRGAVPVALVLTIPDGYQFREIIIHLTFGYILFTLLVQGTTIKALMDLLGIKPDKSYFDSHDGVITKFKFPSNKLAELVQYQITNTLVEEGFYASSEEEMENSVFIRKGSCGLLFETDGKEIKMTTPPSDESYGKQVVYETLLELNESVTHLKDVVHPEKMKKIVQESKASVRKSKPTPPTKLGAFDLGKCLNSKLMSCNLQGTDKNSIIEELIDIGVENGAIKERKSILDAVLERENSMTTGIGNGVSIPHAKSNYIDKLTVIVGIKKDGVDFQSLDKKPAYLFFLIISPKSEQVPHIQVLAEISKKVSAVSVREEIISFTNNNDIYNRLLSKD